MIAARPLPRLRARSLGVLAFLALLGVGAARAQPTAPPKPTAPPPGPAAQLPGVDLSDLDPPEIAALIKLMGEGACPCEPKSSLADCIRAQSCPPATELANFGAARYREGLSTGQVQEAVVHKYTSDFITHTFELEGTPRKGAAKGRVTIVEFADFQCPHCALMRTVLDDVVAAYPKDVTLYFKNFPIGFHSHGESAARAALAAGRQDRFWQMHDLLFDNQSRLTDQRILELASELGLNLERFKKDQADPTIARRVQQDREEGVRSNLSGTPTIFINGKIYLDEKTPEAIKAHIARLLAAPARPGDAAAPPPK